MKTKIPVRPRGLPAYSAWIGRACLEPALREIREKRHAILIYDRKTATSARGARATLRRHFEKVDLLPVTGGEGLKKLASIEKLARELSSLGARGDVVLVALGGGSVGDAIGFLASIYLRGVRWISMPTTLLGQVDSSLGGKTAVNLPEGKNLLGAFHHPIAVVCDLDTLRSLPAREVASALGEIVKYGLAFDPKLLRWTIANWSRFSARKPASLQRAVTESLRWKARIVSQDPFEKLGLRRQLNLGHTFGHAIEKMLAPRIRHGEAVFHGLRAALILSMLRGHLKRNREVAELVRFLQELPLPQLPANPGKLLDYLRQDKKSSRGSTVFILFKKIARLIEDRDVSDADILRTWTALTQKRNSR